LKAAKASSAMASGRARVPGGVGEDVHHLVAGVNPSGPVCRPAPSRVTLCQMEILIGPVMARLLPLWPGGRWRLAPCLPGGGFQRWARMVRVSASVSR